MNLKNVLMNTVKCALVLCAVLGICACGNNRNTDDTTQKAPEEAAQTQINYDSLDLSDYVKSVTYSGMEVQADSESTSRGEELWHAICLSAQISAYPEDKVEYYFNQTKKAYMYIADNNQEDYELLLKNRGTDEQKMMQEAKDRVREDLIYEYILEKEGIVLTEQDKTANFQRYVTKLSQEIGKSESYIVSEMSEYVYEVMLHDKTMEYLLSVNTVELVTSPEETTE